LSDILDRIKAALSDVENPDFDRLGELVDEALKKHTPEEVIEKALRPAMEEVGRKFEEGEYFVAELALIGDVFKDVFERKIKPRLKKKSSDSLGRVVIGTIEGDIHDIGKSIVAVIFEAAGFEVIDLGVDVPAEKFVDEAEKNNADVIAISALLTTSMVNMRKVVEELEKRGVRDKYIVVVGGSPVTEEFARSIGADVYGKDAYDGLKKVIDEIKKRARGGVSRDRQAS